MNPDYIIGSKQPHILFADYVGDASNLKPAADGETAGATDARTNVKTADAAGKTPASDEHELTFDDFIDIINPLQHIPVVNYIYRAITGDKISGFASVVGGGLYGGPLGLVGGVVEAAFNDETGHGPAETMVTDVLGIKDHATMVAEADRTPKAKGDWIDRQYASVKGLVGGGSPEPDPNLLDTQIASAMPEAQTLDSQVASAMPKSQTLDNQIASAMLPPVGPSPVLVAQNKQPFGGVMDMGLVNNARKGPPVLEASPGTQVASDDEAPLAAATPVAASGKPQEVAGDQKFFSLSSVKRLSPGATVAMPVNGGPDVRLKPISRQAINAKPAQPIAIPADSDAEARKILGLPDAGAPVAALNEMQDPSGNLTADQADLQPAYGIKSQAVPNALIEDMMKMGLEKYQKGLSNGSLGGGANIDVRG